MIDRHRINISGATILGDGTAALIVDVPKLIDQAEQEEARPPGGSVKKHSSLRTYL